MNLAAGLVFAAVIIGGLLVAAELERHAARRRRQMAFERVAAQMRELAQTVGEQLMPAVSALVVAVGMVGEAFRAAMENEQRRRP